MARVATAEVSATCRERMRLTARKVATPMSDPVSMATGTPNQREDSERVALIE
jgi:hypothetical protein